MCNFELCNIFWGHLITMLKVLLYFIFSALAEFWFDVFKEVLAEIITETISPALGIDGAVEFARKMENSGLIQTITNLLREFVSTNNQHVVTQ